MARGEAVLEGVPGDARFARCAPRTARPGTVSAAGERPRADRAVIAHGMVPFGGSSAERMRRRSDPGRPIGSPYHVIGINTTMRGPPLEGRQMISAISNPIQKLFLKSGFVSAHRAAHPRPHDHRTQRKHLEFQSVTGSGNFPEFPTCSRNGGAKARPRTSKRAPRRIRRIPEFPRISRSPPRIAGDGRKVTLATPDAPL